MKLTKILKLGKLNQESCEGIVLAIKHMSSSDKVVFILLKKCKNDDFCQDNLAWECLIKKYEPHIVLNIFEEVDHLVGGPINKNGQHQHFSKMIDWELMIHIINSPPDQYNPNA